MKPYIELTRRGRLRRLRELARLALDAYGLGDARLTFLHQEGNAIFRVDSPVAVPGNGEKDLYVAGRYVLRIHTTGNLKAIASELVWLSSLSREAGLPVPDPVPALNGEFLTTIETPGAPHTKNISLLRWLDGRRLSRALRPIHARAWGQLMARLHEYAAGWTPPDQFARPHWDWSGLFGQQGGLWYPRDELVESMPPEYREPFRVVSQEVREVMGRLDRGPDVYGMLHADLYAENVLFRGDRAYAIDFDDCGFGFWMFDIGITLSEWLWTKDWNWFKEAFLDGYLRVRSLPESQLKHLDLFMATRFADLTLWGTAFIKRDPRMREHHETWRNHAGENLLRSLESR